MMTLARVSLLSHKLERMHMVTVSCVNSSKGRLRNSQICVIKFAPMASQVLTMTCNTAIVPPSGREIFRTRISLTPPPRFSMLLATSVLARLIKYVLFVLIIASNFSKLQILAN